MFSLLLIPVAAIGRVLVGMGLANRWLVYVPIALAISYLQFGLSVVGIVFAILAALNVGLGWTDWDNRLHQAVRYSFLPMVGAVAFAISSHDLLVFIWPIMCAFIGSIEIDIRRRLEPYGFTIFGRDISSAQYAEFVIGAVCLGGVALIGG